MPVPSTVQSRRRGPARARGRANCRARGNPGRRRLRSGDRVRGRRPTAPGARPRGRARSRSAQGRARVQHGARPRTPSRVRPAMPRRRAPRRARRAAFPSWPANFPASAATSSARSRGRARRDPAVAADRCAQRHRRRRRHGDVATGPAPELPILVAASTMGSVGNPALKGPAEDVRIDRAREPALRRALAGPAAGLAMRRVVLGVAVAFVVGGALRRRGTTPSARSHASLPLAVLRADEALLYDNTDPAMPHREVAMLRDGEWWRAQRLPIWAAAAIARVTAQDSRCWLRANGIPVEYAAVSARNLPCNRKPATDQIEIVGRRRSRRSRAPASR